MEGLYSEIVGSPVIVEGEKRPLTSVKGLLIDPDRGTLVAFLTDLSRNKVIVPIDVLQWGQVVIVNDSDAVIDGNDVIKVENVQKDGRYFMENKVETEDGQILGKIYDLVMDFDSQSVKKLYVAKGFMGLLRYKSRIIPVSEILKVEKDKVIVKNDVQEVRESEEEPLSIKDAATT